MMQIKSILLPQSIAIGLITLLFGPTLHADGNARLMENAKKRAFKLNEAIFHKLEQMDISESSVSFVGRVVRGDDGSLTISIDEVKPIAARYRSVPNDDIHYITFESMVENEKQVLKQSEGQENTASQAPRPLLGGGAAALKE